MGNRIRVGPGVVIYQQWKTWWIDARGGRERIRRSLRTRDRAVAIQKALDVLNRSSAPPAKLESLQESLERYMRDYSPLHHHPATGKRYRTVVQLFINIVGADSLPNKVTRKHIIDFQQARATAMPHNNTEEAEKAEKTLSPDTVNGELGYVKAFLNWCRAEGMLDHDPCFKVRRLKVNRTKRRTLTPNELKEVMDAIKENEYLHDYGVVAASTGMRPNEVLHVRGCDLDVSKKLLHITAWGDWRTKDAEDRSIELNRAAFRVLAHRRIANGDDALPLFAGKLGTVRDWKNVYHEFKLLLPASLDRVGLYDFRHYFATEAVRRGWSAEKLRLYLGHADIATTLKYYVDVKASQVGAPPDVMEAL